MFLPTGNSQIDRLNSMALDVAKSKDDAFWSLSTGEQCYVALASNRSDLLAEMNYTIAEALARIGDEWISALLRSWKNAGNPTQY
jgi:hypothetical protein